MRYDAKAIGSGSEGAQNELQDSYTKVGGPSLRGEGWELIATQSMTLLEAQVLALKVLKQVMEEKLDHNNVQLAQVRFRSGSRGGAGADEERRSCRARVSRS